MKELESLIEDHLEIKICLVEGGALEVDLKGPKTASFL